MINKILPPLQKPQHEVKNSGKNIHTFWTVAVYDKKGRLKRYLAQNVHNVFPSACIDEIHNAAFIRTVASGRGFGVIALTADTTQTINAAQTALTGEITTNGLDRKDAVTKTHGPGTSTSLIEHTFTLTGTQTDITRAALFNASTAPVSGIMGPFAAFSNGNTGQMVSGETVKVSITITTS